MTLVVLLGEDTANAPRLCLVPGKGVDGQSERVVIPGERQDWSFAEALSKFLEGLICSFWQGAPFPLAVFAE
jgi:hypothetical protein